MTRSLSPRSKEPITTAADLPRAMSGGQQEPELAQRARVAPPVPAHAHGEPQEHRDAEEGLQLASRLGADALEHGAALADQDPLLRLLLDEDGGVDIQPLGPLVLDEVLDAHGHRVRHLLVREVEEVGTALGPHGVNIMEFVKTYNDRTASMAGQVIPVEITIFEDRTFTFVTKTPPAAALLKKAAGVEKGSAKPNKEKVGKVSKQQVREIAQLKLKDLNAYDVEAAMKMIEGTARSLGIEVSA